MNVWWLAGLGVICAFVGAVIGMVGVAMCVVARCKREEKTAE